MQRIARLFSTARPPLRQDKYARPHAGSWRS